MVCQYLLNETHSLIECRPPPIVCHASLCPLCHKWLGLARPIYMVVYTRHFWQGNCQVYGHIRCILYTVLAKPVNGVNHVPSLLHHWSLSLCFFATVAWGVSAAFQHLPRQPLFPPMDAQPTQKCLEDDAVEPVGSVTARYIKPGSYRYLRLARTIYIHRIRPYIWWFPCHNYGIYTRYIWFWPTLQI